MKPTMTHSLFCSVLLGSLLLACAHSSPTVSPLPVTPEPPPLPRKEEPTPARTALPDIVEGEGWRISPPVGWVRVPPKLVGDGIRVEFVANSPEDIGSLPAVLTIMSGDSGGSAVSFIESYTDALQQADDEIKVLKTRKMLVSGEPALMLLAIRKLPNESVVATLDLVTGNAERGYVVSCGGDPNEGDEIGKPCFAALQSFQMK